MDRAALPWPLVGLDAPSSDFTPTEAWLAEQWQAVLGMPVPGPKADFFDLGGGSLAAAQLVSIIRTRAPEFSVADIYDVPRLGTMAKALGTIVFSDDAATFHRPAADTTAHAVDPEPPRSAALRARRASGGCCIC